MRKRGRTDDNQVDIVKALRKAGASVQILSGVGQGCPDLLVGRARKMELMECKDGDKPESQQKLTPDEIDWHGRWRGTVAIVHSVEEALEVLNQM